MIKIINCEQGSPEWFKYRCGSVGASRVKDATAGGQGKSRKTLAYQLISEEITGEKTEMFCTPAMQYGIDNEPEARAAFSFQENVELEEVGLVINTDFPGCHASPDGLSFSGKKIVTGVEIKVPNGSTLVKYIHEGRLPPEYVKQVQFTMMICELESYWFFAYRPGFSRNLSLEIERDYDVTNSLATGLESFFKEKEGIAKKIGEQ